MAIAVTIVEDGEITVNVAEAVTDPTALKKSQNLADLPSAPTALGNIGGEAIANKSTDGTMTANSPDLYPSQSAVVAYGINSSGSRRTIGVQADATIELCKFSWGLGGYFTAGVKGWAPSGPDGAHAGVFYTRDFAMMVRGRPTYFSAAEILGVIGFLASIQGEDGRIYEATSSGGVPNPAPPYPTSPDGVFYWIDLIYSHYTKSGEITAYETYASNITLALTYPTVSNHLVSITDDADDSNVQGCWGFTDTLATTGRELFCSALRFQAYTQLAELAIASGASGSGFAAEAALIKTALQTHLWDGTRGLFRNSDGDNNAHSIPGSAFVASIGACSPTISAVIAQKLIDMRPGGVDEDETIYFQGYIRHIPSSESWDRFRSFVPPDTYQDGGFWSVFTAWVAKTISIVDPAIAEALMAEFVGSTAGSAGERPYEHLGPAYTNSPNYGPSAALPYEFYIAPWEKQLTYSAILEARNSFSQPQELPALHAPLSEVTLDLNYEGLSLFRFGKTRTPWLMKTTSEGAYSKAGGLIISDRDSSTTPPVVLYTSANTNLGFLAQAGEFVFAKQIGETGTADIFRVGGYGFRINGAGTFSTTSPGIALFGLTDGYKIGFDSVGGTRGLSRYNVDTANSNIHGHVFSGGTPGAQIDYALLNTEGRFSLKTRATAPSNPPSGMLALWAKTDGTFHILDSAGVDKTVTAA